MKPIVSFYKRLIYFLSSFYSISRSEAIGFTLLIPLIFLLIATPFWYKHLRSVNLQEDASAHAAFMQWREALRANLESAEPTTAEKVPDINLRRFNPNTADSEELQQLGFAPWIAERIVKYRASGGSFSIKSDLKKIYGIPEALVESVWDYMELPEKIDKPTEKKETTKPTYHQKAEDTKSETVNNAVKIVKNLNLATAEDFADVRGIGEVLSTRIVRYREQLGGFVSPDQLGEVYGLSPEVLTALQENFTIENLEIQQKNINQATTSDLAGHPYIDRKLANAIVQYRVQHGDFDHIKDLRHIKILSDSVYHKILPYLKLN